MKIIAKNIFDADGNSEMQEIFQEMVKMDHALVERIVTQKPYTEPGEWYDQEQDEWVLLLQGKASIEIKDQGIIDMDAGDYICIPARCMHRVTRTSAGEVCVWLAVHGRKI